MNTTASMSIWDNLLRAIASAMRVPVMVILVICFIGSLVLLGWLLAEYLEERRHLHVSLPSLLEDLQTCGDVKLCISNSGLLRRQKRALIELASHPGFSMEMRESLAVRILDWEQECYDRVLRYSELLVRLAPVFGLLGTLIPLGPGIIALGQGDTYTLSQSMLTAFDTTIAGLLAAAIGTVVTSLRKAWYNEYMSVLEVLCQCILDRAAREDGV